MKGNTERIVKAATAAALSAALAFGGVAPSVALAAVGTDKGTISVTATSASAGMQYNAYKIFTCDVDLRSGTTDTYDVSGISWPNDAMETAVQDAIASWCTKNSITYSGTSAHDAATFIADKISGTTSDTRVAAGSFAEALSQAVDNVSDPAPTTLTAGADPVSMDEGYYLIVSKPDSVTGSMVGTSPIFTTLGKGQELSVGEKSSVPTLTKKLVEDSAPEELRSYADAHTGQHVSYTLTGTVPDNIASFATYVYAFEDQLPEGMDLVCATEGDFSESDVSVQIGSQGVDASSFEATYADRMLKVAFADLKSAKDESGLAISIDDSTKVTVTYNAKLNGDAIVGATGNANTVHLRYSNNPQVAASNLGTLAEDGAAVTAQATGTSTANQATVYEYQLKLYKYDKDELEGGVSKAVSNAQFTIQATKADDTDSTGKYVQGDGSLSAEPYTFATASDGLINVKGLDAGTYTLAETAAPDGYNMIEEPLVLTITPSFWAAGDANIGTNPVGSFKAVTATLAGGNGDANTKVSGSDDGVITIQATDELKKLPTTGLSGITLTYVAGGTILVASVAVIAYRRLKKKD